MVVEYYDYLKFIDDALEVAKALPRYFSKFDKKIYCNHQKFGIYVLMQKLKTTTRGIVSILRASSDMRMHLGLKKVPSHSTIVRFVNKIRKDIAKLLGIRQAVSTAVDATGFELESKSYYYRNIDKCLFNHRRRTKKFMKLSIAVDVDKQTVLTYKIRKSIAHDTRDFKFLIKNLKTKEVLADKGYSSKGNRQFVINNLNAIPIIPKKSNERDYYISLGKVLKLDKEKYIRRGIVENIFFCIKRKYGSVLRNKSLRTQKVELISKLIAHNVDRRQHYVCVLLRVAPAPLIVIFKYSLC